MIQVYKKNELFVIEDTITETIYPNLTREETVELLKKFDRDEPEDRCDFAIKEDNISFEYASIDDKDKTIADLKAKLVESESKRKSLEEKIKFLTEETEENFVDGQKYNQLKHQLAIIEKALELACERVKYFEEMQDKEMGFYEFFGYDSNYDLKAIIGQYKQQAKEMLENE